MPRLADLFPGVRTLKFPVKYIRAVSASIKNILHTEICIYLPVVVIITTWIPESVLLKEGEKGVGDKLGDLLPKISINIR